MSLSLTRRAFMKAGAMAVVSTTAVPSFLVRSVLAQTSSAQGRRRTLVVVFARGAADGLNIVIPHGEANYYQMRPSIAIGRDQVIDLDHFFGLHPAISGFKPLFDQGHLAIVHAAGSPDPSRSHFDAQDYMESGTPGIKSTPDGWLNRALQAEAARMNRARGPFDAVALGPQIPRTLEGAIPAVAFNRLQDFSIAGRDPRNGLVGGIFEAMYDESADPALRGAGEDTFAAMKMLQAADPSRYQPAPGIDYPTTAFGAHMKQIVQLIKAGLGVEAAFTDIGGWDTHQNQGGADGQMANVLRDFSQGVVAFWQDLGDRAEEVVLVTMSEFGRTARQNGAGGTDHGHANVMFVLGGTVRGGKVYGQWPGLAAEQLHDGRDLAVTTDFRQVLGEAAYRTLGARRLDQVFPGGDVSPSRFLNLLSA